jgi:hypothetical protein
MTRSFPHFNPRVLTVFLLTALPGLIFAVILVLALSQARLSESAAEHLQDVARHTAANVDAYVFRRILDISVLARTPDLRQAAAQSSAGAFDQRAADTVERAWAQTGSPPPHATALMATAGSRYLAGLVGSDRLYREILVTDMHGRTVAASHVPGRYLHTDEDWWRAVVEDRQRGRVSVSDVRWDPEARVHAISIAVPVPAPDDERLAGVLRVVGDSREMLAFVGNVQMGQTGTAWLLRRNGGVVFSRHTTDPNARFWAADRVRTSVDGLAESESIGGSSFVASGPDDRRWVVGLAESQLRTSYPSLGWIVAVAQARDEVVAPVAAVGWYLLSVLALMTVLVMGVALYFSMRLSAPVVDVDLPVVEHPAISHVGETDDNVARA